MASGVIKMTSGKAWKGKIVWSSTPDIPGNFSTVSIKVYTWKTDGYATSGGGWFDGSAWIRNYKSEDISYEQEDKNYDESSASHNPILRASFSVKVPHASDGTKTVEIGASITKGYSTSLANTTLSGSETITLDQIPRTSSFAATDAAIGSVSTITIYRESSNLNHRIKVEFGSVTGYVTNSGGFSSSASTITGTSIAFTIPTDFYQAIPNAKRGTCKLTLYTLSGSSVVGEEVTIEVEITTLASRCSPTLTMSLTHDNSSTSGLTGSNTAYIRGYSDAKCKVSASAKYGATIKKIWTDGEYTDNKDGTYTISPVNSETIVFYAQDSRGYTGQISTTITLVPYIVLTNSASAGRPNPTDGSASVQFQGQYFNGSFGSTENSLTVRYKIENADGSVYKSWTTVTASITEDSYSAYVSLSGLDYTKTFKVYTEATDKLLTVKRDLVLRQGIPTFDWGRSNFQFHVPVYIMGHLVDVPEVLYTSSDAYGAYGSIPLSQEVSNFEYIEIFFNDNNGRGSGSTKIFEPEGKEICLFAVEPNLSQTFYFRRSGFLISGKEITYQDNGGYAYFDGTAWNAKTGNCIRITRVVGHNRTSLASISAMYESMALASSSASEDPTES